METLRMIARKWPDLPHWESEALLLGQDEHGTWVGQPPGTLMSRPGSTFRTAWSQVTVVPAAAPYVATFYDTGRTAPVEVYVDVTTHATWGEDSVSVVDLDLDVIRGWTGRVWVDDEDEFAEHRVALGYPAEVVELASGSCEAVRAAVTAGHPPYDGPTAARWLERLDALRMGT